MEQRRPRVESTHTLHTASVSISFATRLAIAFYFTPVYVYALVVHTSMGTTAVDWGGKDSLRNFGVPVIEYQEFGIGIRLQGG